MTTATLNGYYADVPNALSGERSEALGSAAMRASLSILFLWLGAMKFTSFEALAIAPFMANSPLLSWLPELLGLQGASYLLGVLEIATGALLLAGFTQPILSAIGGAMAAITMLITLSLMFTTPGVAEPLAGGFPALSAVPGQMLLKDVALLGMGIFILGESLLRMQFSAASTSTNRIGQRRVAVVYDTDPAARLFKLGTRVLRYGLVLIFFWFGAMKFTSYEANGIAPFIANSPLVAWWHELLGIQGTSTVLGVFEIATGVLLLMCPLAPRVCAIGGAMAVLTFLVTTSFFFTTPGVAAPQGLPVLSVVGQFLAKDFALLSVSIWLLGEALVGSAGGRYGRFIPQRR
jgi:reactive chlorine resistance protein C